MDRERQIRTPRLLLRPLERSDGDALLPLIQNWNVARWLAVVPWPYEAADMAHFIDEIAGPRRIGPDPIFTVLLGGSPIGTAECRREVAGSETPGQGPSQLGYWLGEPYWGRGYGTEAASALVARAFEDLRVDAIRSGVFEGNDASLAVQRKLGFEVVDTVTAMCRPQKRELPLIRTRVTRARHLARAA